VCHFSILLKAQALPASLFVAQAARLQGFSTAKKSRPLRALEFEIGFGFSQIVYASPGQNNPWLC
jgi:hypothetical protein